MIKRQKDEQKRETQTDRETIKDVNKKRERQTERIKDVNKKRQRDN